MMQNPPPGAKGFFIGDQLGGSGWEVELPDGTVAKYYVTVPDHLQDNIRIRFHFRDAPRTHGGQVLQDTSVERLAQLYIEYLRNIVAEARAQFSR